jgi:hypothetical protein
MNLILYNDGILTLRSVCPYSIIKWCKQKRKAKQSISVNEKKPGIGVCRTLVFVRIVTYCFSVIKDYA